jgi:hypothetical protein
MLSKKTIAAMLSVFPSPGAEGAPATGILKPVNVTAIHVPEIGWKAGRLGSWDGNRPMDEGRSLR